MNNDTWKDDLKKLNFYECILEEFGLAPADESLNELVELIQALLNEKNAEFVEKLKSMYDSFGHPWET